MNFVTIKEFIMVLIKSYKIRFKMLLAV